MMSNNSMTTDLASYKSKNYRGMDLPTYTPTYPPTKEFSDGVANKPLISGYINILTKKLIIAASVSITTMISRPAYN